MASSGVSVAPESVTVFNEIKLGKSVKWVIYKIADNGKEIVVEEKSTEGEWAPFREKLLNAKSKNKAGKEVQGPRYAVFDVEYELESGDGKRNKLAFISWIPDDTAPFVKMLYSSSKDALKRALNGVAAEIQANDPDELEFDSVKSKVSRGR